MNLDTPSWKNQFLYPFLELIGSWWCYTSQTNFDTPSWQTNFYIPFWNSWVKGEVLPLKRILIPLHEKPISISLSGIDRVTGDALPLKWILIPLHERTNFDILFLSSWVKGDALPLKRILIVLHEKPVSIVLSGIYESRVMLYLSNGFWYHFLKNQFLYPFLEFMSQGWYFTSQTNFDTPSWKTNFYTPLWNW